MNSAPSVLRVRWLTGGLLLVLCVVLGTRPLPVAAAPGTVPVAAWSTSGPYSGKVNSLAIDPSNTATLYAGTVDGLYKSGDRGATWALLNAAFGGVVLGVATSHLAPVTVYALTAAGIYTSTNAGSSWSLLNSIVVQSNTFAVNDSVSPATLYAGQSNGVYKSLDGGASFARVVTTDIVTALAIAPGTPNTLYASSYQGGSADHGVYVSSDGGTTWTLHNSGLTGCDLGNCHSIRSFAVSPTTSTTVFGAGDFAGVYRSTDGGGTWSVVLDNLTVTGGTSTLISGQAIAVDPSNASIVYAGLRVEGIWRSTDGGSSWSPVSGTPRDGIRALAIDPTSPTSVYAGFSLAGVYKSSDHGANWSVASKGLAGSGLNVHAVVVDPATSAYVYTATEVGVYRSTDGGASWAMASTGIGSRAYVLALAIDATNGTIYAGVDQAPGTFQGAVYRSTDHGSSWTAVTGNIGEVDVLTADPVATGTVIRAVNCSSGQVGCQNGIYRSTDYGATWTGPAAGAPLAGYNSLAIAVDPHHTGTLYAVDVRYVSKSTDGGASWTQVYTGAQYYSRFNSITIDPFHANTVYVGESSNAGDANGVLKSSDGGANWTAVNTGLNTNVFTVALDPVTPNTVYAGTSTGVYRSTDAGATWSDYSTGQASVGASVGLGMSPAAPVTLYVAVTAGSASNASSGIGGVWQRALPVVATAPTVTTQPASQSVSTGSQANFTAAASGSPVPTVQWQQSTDSGALFTDISGATATTYSFTATLPQSGTQYRAVFTNGAGSATSSAATLTVSCSGGTKADISSPTGGSITSTTPTFQWGGGVCVTQYYLFAGSSAGQADYYNSGALAGTVSTATVSPAIPLDGRTIYVRLWSLVNGTYQAVDHSYLMGACNSGAKADITSPTGGSITTGTPTFQWGGGTCVTQYYLYIGNSFGQSDLFSSGPLSSTTTQATVSPAIPVDGRTIYVRLWSLVNGNFQPIDHSYIMGACNNPNRAEITSPTGGSITSTTPTFQWGGGACVTQYYLYVGSSTGQSDLFAAGPLSSTTAQATVSPAIPLDGRTIYVRLWSLVNGTYQAVDHSYLMGACNSGAKADITSPTGGSITTGTPTFQWGGGTCVTQYYLYIGNSFGQSDLFSSGPLSSTTTQATVSPAIPVDGRTIYVRLWSLVNGNFQPVDHSYLMGACNNPGKADISSPTAATLNGASQIFQWSGGACVTQYYLYIGSSFGGADIASRGPLSGTTTAQTVTLPADGSTVYLRLWSLVNGTYQAVDRSYVSAP